MQTYAIGGGWGNHISWLNDGVADRVGLDDGTVGQGHRKVYGHKSFKPRLGDLLTCQMQSGRIGIFKFVEIEYLTDPDDMFFGTVEFLEYEVVNNES